MYDLSVDGFKGMHFMSMRSSFVPASVKHLFHFILHFILVGNESLKNCESANHFVVVTYRISSNTERWCIIFFNNNFYSWKRENCLDSYKRFVRLIRLTPQQDWTNSILWNRCFSIDFIWQHIDEKGKDLPKWFASGLKNGRNWRELNYRIRFRKDSKKCPEKSDKIKK